MDDNSPSKDIITTRNVRSPEDGENTVVVSVYNIQSLISMPFYAEDANKATAAAEIEVAAAAAEMIPFYEKEDKEAGYEAAAAEICIHKAAAEYVFTN